MSRVWTIALKLTALVLPTGFIMLYIAINPDAHHLRLPVLALVYASFPLAWWAIGNTFQSYRGWQLIVPVFLMLLWSTATLFAGAILTVTYGCSLYHQSCL